MGTSKSIISALGVLAAGLATAACGNGAESANTASGASLPRGSEKVDLNPADFTTNIDNPYWPMKPGSRWVFRESDTEGSNERVVVKVTD